MTDTEGTLPLPAIPRRLIALSSSITFATYVLALGTSVVLLISTSVGKDLLGSQARLVLGAFLVLPISTPVTFNSFGGFLGILAIYLACFAIALKTRGGFLQNLRELARGLNRKIPSWLVVMPLGSSALLIVVIAITEIQDLLGVPTGNLSFPPSYSLGQQFYALAYSPLVEELTFRITALGLLVALRVAWLRPQTPTLELPKRTVRLLLLSFFFPDRAKTEAGLPNIISNGWRGIHSSEWILLMMTSAIFGLAHILTNSGWQVGKVLTAALSGFALGLAYLAYGAYASILLHWFFNFYFEVYNLSRTLLGGVFDFLAGVVSLLTLSVGILGIAVGVILLLRGRPVTSGTTYMAPSGPPTTI